MTAAAALVAPERGCSMTSGFKAQGVRCALSAFVLLAAGGLAWPGAAAQAAADQPAEASARAVTAAARPAAGIISTVAGGVGGPGPGVNVALNPCGVKFARGALYIGAGAGGVRKVDPRTDWLTSPLRQTNGASGATDMCSLTVDSAGNLLVASPIRVKVLAHRTGRFYGRKMIAGHLYVILSRGTGGVELDHAGNVILADPGSPPNRGGELSGAQVRVLAERNGRFYGRRMTAGQIYTVAGTEAPLPGSRSLATRAWLGMSIGTVRADRFGNLVIPDSGTLSMPAPIPLLASSVRVVAERTGRMYGRKMTTGHIYTIAGNGTFASTGDGGLATKAALRCAAGTALDHAGNVIIADCRRLRVVAEHTGRFYGRHMTAGRIYSIAGHGSRGYSGDGRPASHARVTATAVTVDSFGDVAFADVFRVRVVATRTGHFYGREMRAGDIYTVAGNGTASSGDHGPARKAELSATGLADSRSGNLLIVDSTSLVRLTAAVSGTFFGQKMTKGDIYTIAGNGQSGYSGDGAPATKAALDVVGAATDRAGNVLLAGGDRVRVVAARSGRFYGQRMMVGHIYTIAGDGTTGVSGNGGPARRSPLNVLWAVAIDHAGNVLVADRLQGDYRLIADQVQVVAAVSGTFYGLKMTAGDIYTIAGDGQFQYSGDGGPATAAAICPLSLAVDHAGNVLIGEWFNNRVRLVAESTGTFYGQPMTAGDIYTIAGNGLGGSSGDRGPATSASLFGPGRWSWTGPGTCSLRPPGCVRWPPCPARSTASL